MPADLAKTKEELVVELEVAQRKIVELQKVDPERTQAEEALRIEKDNLVRILESMEDGVCIISSRYEIEYLNPVLRRDLGEPDGRKCYEYFHDRKEVCPECRNEGVFAGKTARWEWCSPKNLKTYDLVDTPFRKLGGGVSKLEIFRDITDRKRMERELEQSREELEERVRDATHELRSANANLRREIAQRGRTEEELRESEGFLRNMLESIQDGISVLNSDLTIQHVNPAMEKWYSDRMPLAHKKCYEVYQQADKPCVSCPTLRALKSGRVETDIVPGPAGSSIEWIELHSYPIRDESTGKTNRVIKFARDITERKRAEEALHKAKDAAEAANRSKSEFLANMSHEVRTPLNGMLGVMQILRETPLTSEQNEYLELGLTAGKGLTHLMNDILDLSKIEARALDIREEEFNLFDFIHSVLESFTSEAARKNLAFHPTIESELPSEVVGDSGRIRQVLFNLVGNAIKFTEKGEVKVKTFAYGLDKDSHRFDLCFEVSDTGIGIPHDKLETIFEPFTQVDGSYSRHYGGTGLGLSIVKRLVDLMRGTVQVESEIGVGTTFLVSLPAKTLEDASPIETKPSVVTPPPDAVKSMSSLHILLAEDDLSNQLVARRLLEKQGHTVTCVATGKEALAALKKKTFDLIFMDIQMPTMDGTEATMEIRKDERFKGLPIIALTAYAMAGDRERFLEVGMNDYVTKPIDMEELKTVIARCMSK